MTKKELFEGAGKYWVETKEGKIGCVMERGVVFKDEACHEGNYNDNLSKNLWNEDPIVKIYKLKQNDVSGYFDDKDNFELVWETTTLKPITSLDQLEEVRREMCEKYNASFYITNKSGEWEIKFNDTQQFVGEVSNFNLNVAMIRGINTLVTAPLINLNNNAESGDKVFLDWEFEGRVTTDPFRAVNLEKEGYEVKF